ncbi:MAG: PEGA domain-containing protein [Deltaproteobacteria bacterium]|nr:PEGA domain-containing protein [Deltaproteobacteria bacterium]
MTAIPSWGRAEPVGGPLGLVVDPVGAEVLIDGRTVGRAPMRPLRLEPGLHTVVIRARGHVPVTRTLELRPHAEITLAVVLEPVPVRHEARPRIPTGRHAAPSRVERTEESSHGPHRRAPRPERRSGSDTEGRSTPLGRGPLLWTGLGLTVALAAGAVVTGALALSAESEYREPDTSEARRRGLDRQIRELSTVTDVLVDGAIVLGLATVALFALAGPDDDPAATGGLGLRGGLGALHWEL